ncbi:MAG: dihydropteroate synthase [Marmoricola sp.]
MISLPGLAALAERYADDLAHPVRPVRIGDRVIDTDAEPVLMGTVNLSRDSTYRESVAVSAASAIRKARIQAAQGAQLVDLGAESSTARAARVDGSAQADRLLPVIETLAADGIAVSVESYLPEVVDRALDAGARVVNLTGSADDAAIFEMVARHGATVILCLSLKANVREVGEADTEGDPIPAMLDHFASRVAAARAAGVEEIVLDPGLGFYYGNTVDPVVRVGYQSRVIAQTFRLRSLGLPICHAMPHAFDLFEDEFRTAEGFFTVLAALGGTGVYRTHEVPRVRAVLGAVRALSVDG